MGFYQFFKDSYIDSLIIFIFLLYTLYCLTGSKNRHILLYITGGSISFFLIYNVSSYFQIFMESPFPGSPPTHPYWFYFFCNFFLAVLFSHLFLAGSDFVKITYILYYLSVLQLYQIICSPLYDAVVVLAQKQYMTGDILTTLLRYFLIFCFSLLLKKHRLTVASISYKPQYMFVLYFPVSLLLFYQMRLRSSWIAQYSEPILSAIILPNLPIMYYLFSSLTDYYQQQGNLNNALYETKNQLARYRYSIELEERIKKERHELRNNYLYIQSLLNLKQYEKLDQYLSGHIKEKMEAISSISTGNLMIDYLLNRKTAEARKKGIKIYTEVFVPEHMSVNEEIFCTVFLNLIDNAIEASLEEVNSDIHITLKAIQNYLSCCISNKINPKRIASNPQFLTTKEDKRSHGLGRIIVKEALAENNGIFQDQMDGNYYTVKFMLPFLPSGS